MVDVSVEKKVIGGTVGEKQAFSGYLRYVWSHSVTF